MQKPPPFRAFIHPRYWPTWTGIGLLVLIAWLPLFIRVRIGTMIGILTHLFGRERRYITAVNIGICYPQLDAQQQRSLVRKIFRENGIGLIETAACWVRKPQSFSYRISYTGLEQMQAARTRGKGILLIGAHYSTLDLGANLLSLVHPIAVTYRPHGNALFDAFMLRGRLSHCAGVFDRFDIRGAFRHLRAGGTLWYAPDQDYGPDQAVYAPFFGRTAATITTVSRYAAYNDSAVFMARHHRIPGGNHYEFEFTPFPDDFPGADPLKDAAVVNHMIETAIRKHPEQYLWMHKRFKTQPGGKPDSPYIDIHTPNRRLGADQYRDMLAGAAPLPDQGGHRDFILVNGLRLRQYPGIIGNRFYQRHPAKSFDRLAKDLRLHGINCVTVDNFFRVPAMHVCAVTYYMPQGRPLDGQDRRQLPLDSLAAFMARLHEAGFHCRSLRARQLVLDKGHVGVADPEGFTFTGVPASVPERRAALTALAGTLSLDGTAAAALFSHYADCTGVTLPIPEKA